MESAGMHGSLMGVVFESFVIDNDILGAVQRTVRGIEVTDDTLSYEVIKEVSLGNDGHYLGSQQTIDRMETDYFYPDTSDRDSPSVWEENGSLDVQERARAHTKKVLATHYPSHIDEATDAKIRAGANILLPRAAMKPGNGRW
jgi:trimethylamine--corrinoid protein Co-methyltransferase